MSRRQQARASVAGGLLLALLMIAFILLAYRVYT